MDQAGQALVSVKGDDSPDEVLPSQSKTPQNKSWGLKESFVNRDRFWPP